MLELLFGIGLFWWGFAAVASILIILALENESDVTIAFVAVVGALVVWAHGGFETPTVHGVLEWFNEWTLRVIALAAAYFAIGTCWGVAKWFFYVHNQADSYEQMRSSYLVKFDQYKASGGRSAYLEWLNDSVYGDSFPPNPKKNKHRIMMWMVYWPWSALWTLLNDPIKRIYRFIYQNLVTTYTAISNAVFGNRFSEFKS